MKRMVVVGWICFGVVFSFLGSDAYASTNGVATLPFSEGFETGTLSPCWTVGGTGGYRTQVETAYVPASGSHHLTMDSSGSYARNELTLCIDLDNHENVVLDFWAKEFGDEAHGPPSSPFVGGADFDGIAISADGTNWYEVAELRTLGSTYAQRTVDLDAAVSTHGLSYNSTFWIRFNQYDNYPLSTDGIAIDDISITGNVADELKIVPSSKLSVFGYEGGPFSPTNQIYTLTNIGTSNLPWTVSAAAPWVGVSPMKGVLAAGETNWVTVSVDSSINSFPPGTNVDTVVFSNVASGRSQLRDVQVEVRERMLDRFVWDLIGPTQRVTVAFSVQVFAVDQTGALFAEYTNSVDLTGFADGEVAGNSLLQETSYTDSWTGGDRVRGFRFTPTNDISVTHVRRVFGDKVAIWTDTGTLLAEKSVSGPSGTWVEAPLDSPVDLTAGQSYRIGAYLSTPAVYYADTAGVPTVFPDGTIDSGCSFNGGYQAPLNDSPGNKYLVDMIYTVGANQSITISPTNTGSFVAGVWIGSMTILEGAANLVLRADDGAGHTGDSNPFNVDPLMLSVWVPESASEGDGAVAGEIRVNVAPLSNLVVTLVSDDLSEATVAANVVILAGQTHVLFDVIILDDSILDGSQLATLTASTSNYLSGASVIDIHDNETASLTLSLPQTTYEGSGKLEGVLQVDSPPDNDIQIELKSSDTNEISSSTVIIPAGQTVVPVEFVVVDDEVMDGVKTVVVEASVDNWTGDTCHVFVFDNEQVAIAPEVPEEPEEGSETFKLVEVGQLTGMAGVTKIEYCPERDLLFLMSGTDVRIMRGASGEVLGTRVATETFTDMDLTRDGRYLFVADYGGERTGYGTPINPHHVHRYDLDNDIWLSAQAPKIAWKIEAVAPDRVLLQEHDQHVDMTLNRFGATMVELSRIRADYYGDLEYDPVTKRAYHGSSGSSSSEIHVRTVSGDTLVMTEGTGTYGTAQSGGGTSVLSTDGAYFFYGRLQVEAMNIRSNVRMLPEYIYAASARIAFGKESYYAADTGLELGEWGFTSGTLGVSEDGRHVWAYDAASSTLYHYIDAMVVHVTVPVDAQEGDGLLSVSGSVDVAEAPASNLVFNLSSSIPDEVEVPASVTVLAGETNAAFDIVVLDDSLIDGSQPVAIFADPDQQMYAGSEGVIVVHDNEFAMLSLTLPQSTVEGSGGISGMVNVNPIADRDVVVNLLSDNLEKISGGRVVIKAGDEGAAFTLSVLDNDLIDHLQTATIEARVENWESAKASIFIADNESTEIQLVLPSFTMEGDGLATNAGEVVLSGMLLSDVHIVLKSLDSSEVTVPFYVTIPAGQTNAFFNITAMDDAVVDGKQYPVITASAPGFVPGSQSMSVSDNEFHHFTMVGFNGEDPGYVPVPCSVHAVNMDDEYVNTYSGPAWLSGVLGSDPVAVDPAEAITLTNGLWQGTVTFHGAGDDALIFTDDGQGHVGTNRVSLAGFNIVKMETDWGLPYIYMIHRYESSPNKSILVWYNTDSNRIEHAVSAGENATDLAVSYADNRIYVSNHGRAETRVFDRSSKAEQEPLLIGTDVYHIEAGRAGRIYTVDNNSYSYLYAYDSTNGTQLARSDRVYRGDSACTLDGRYLYYCESYSSDTILKYDVSGDTFSKVKEVPIAGSRNIELSMDGKRVFTNKQVYDTDLNLLLNLGAEIYAASAYGDLAITSTKAYNGVNGEEIYSLPFSSTVMAFSGDQSELLLFDSISGSFTSLATSVIMPLPTLEMVPVPADGSVQGANLSALEWTVSPVAVGYDVYLGTDSNAVVMAATNDVEYLGRMQDGFIELPEGTLSGGQTYYWRVDVAAFGGQSVTGAVWSFSTPAIYLEPNALALTGVVADYTQRVDIAIGAMGGTANWTASCADDWVELGETSGTAPTTLQVAFDMARLSAGEHETSILFSDGTSTMTLPVTISMETLRVVKMATDWKRPYVYAAHTSETTPNKSMLIWYNTETETIEYVADAGVNVTDLTVHYAEDRIYVNNSGRADVRVFDRTTKVQLDPLPIGSYARVNAGLSGALIAETGRTLKIFDTATAATLASGSSGYNTGDGEASLDGSMYYHIDQGTSGSRLRSYDVSANTFLKVSDVKPRSYYGSSRIVVSGDGQRVFTCGAVHRSSDLREITYPAKEMHAASFYGRYAVAGVEVLDIDANEVALTLPVTGAISAFSKDQSKLVLFDAASDSFVVQDLAAVSGLREPGLAPSIADGAGVPFSQSALSWAREPFATHYQVYLGRNESDLGAANTHSPTYLGESSSASIALPKGTLVAGQTYYWRVDAIGPNGLLTSELWSFTAAELGFTPAEINMPLFNIDGLTNTTLAIDNLGGSVAWGIIGKPDWMSVDVSYGVGDSAVVLSIDKSALAMGENEGSLTIASAAGSFDIPVTVLRLNEVVKCFEPAADGKIYAASYESGHDQSYLLEISAEPFAATRVIELPENITDMDIDPAGTNLYAIGFMDGSLAKVDLPSFELVDVKVVPGTSKHSQSTHFNIAARADGIVYYLDGNWAPTAHVFDFDAGVDLSTQSNGGEGLGGLLYDAERQRIYSWRQYGWSAGSGTSWVYAFDAAGQTLTKLQTSSSQNRDPLASPLLLVDDGQSLINKKRRFNADDLTVVEATYAQDIYAATPDGTLAIGSTKVYRGTDGIELATLPVSSALRSSTAGGEAMVWYNSSSKSIELTYFADLFDPLSVVSNTVPETGATVMYSRGEFSWDGQDGARTFNVYLGTDAAAVAAATTDSPEFLDAVQDPMVAIPSNTLEVHQTYYWRVDAVGYDAAVVIGAVSEFRVASLSADSGRVDLQLLDTDYTARFELELSSDLGDSATWSVSSSDTWMVPQIITGSGAATIEVEIDVSALPEGVYEASISIEDASRFAIVVPVGIEVFPLNITKMEADQFASRVYALNVVQTGTKPSQLVVMNTDTRVVEHVIPVVNNASDFAIHYGDNRVYASAFGNAAVSVIDRATSQRLEDLTLHTHVYRISSGTTGRLVTEDDGMGNGYYGRMHVWDSLTGVEKQTTASYSTGRGTGESDAAGLLYYRGDSTRYPYTGYLRKYDLSGGTLTQMTSIGASKSSRRELVVSADGARVFWIGQVYDSDLTVITNLSAEVYAASQDGSMAATTDKVLDADFAYEIAALPTASTAMAFVDNDTMLAFFNPVSKAIEWLALAPAGSPGIAESVAFQSWMDDSFQVLESMPDAMADSDMDGQSNLDEFIAGTDPTKAESCFMVHNVELQADGSIVIHWDAVTNRVYSVYLSPSLTEPFQLLKDDIHYPQNTYTDQVQRAESQGFYRINVDKVEEEE